MVTIGYCIPRLLRPMVTTGYCIPQLPSVTASNSYHWLPHPIVTYQQLLLVTTFHSYCVQRLRFTMSYGYCWLPRLMVYPLTTWGPGITSLVINLQSCWVLNNVDSRCTIFHKICEVHWSVHTLQWGLWQAHLPTFLPLYLRYEEQLSGSHVWYHSKFTIIWQWI